MTLQGLFRRETCSNHYTRTFRNFLEDFWTKEIVRNFSQPETDIFTIDVRLKRHCICGCKNIVQPITSKINNAGVIIVYPHLLFTPSMSFHLTPYVFLNTKHYSNETLSSWKLEATRKISLVRLIKRDFKIISRKGILLNL